MLAPYSLVLTSPADFARRDTARFLSISQAASISAAVPLGRYSCLKSRRISQVGLARGRYLVNSAGPGSCDVAAIHPVRTAYQEAYSANWSKLYQAPRQ